MTDRIKGGRLHPIWIAAWSLLGLVIAFLIAFLVLILWFFGGLGDGRNA